MSLGDHTFSLSTAVFAKYMYVRPIASSRPRAAPWHCLSVSDCQAVRSDSPTGPKDRQNHQETHTGLPRCRAPAGGLQKFSAPPPRQNAVVKSHGPRGRSVKVGSGEDLSKWRAAPGPYLHCSSCLHSLAGLNINTKISVYRLYHYLTKTTYG